MRVELFSVRDDRLIVEQDTAGLTLRLCGVAGSEFLSQVLEGGHREAIARRLPGVTLNLTALEPLDPAAVKTLIKWAMIQAELDPQERYAIRLQYAEGITWQKVSMAAVAHLCPYVQLEPSA